MPRTLLPCSLLPAMVSGLGCHSEWSHLEEPGAGESREPWARSRLNCCLCLSGNCTGCSATFSVLKKRVSLSEDMCVGIWDEKQGSEWWGVIGPHWAWGLRFAQVSGDLLSLCPHLHQSSTGCHVCSLLPHLGTSPFL